MVDMWEVQIIMEENTMINDETKKKLDMMGMHALVEALELQEKESSDEDCPLRLHDAGAGGCWKYQKAL